MVHRNRARSSSLFLMELILAILFFSVASAVCVQFFVKSHLMSRESGVLTNAVNECSGIAEIICTTDSLSEGVRLLRLQYAEGEYPEWVDASDAQDTVEDDPVQQTRISFYYDEFFEICERTNAAYALTVDLTQEEQMINVVLEVNASRAKEGTDEPVYRLETRHHIARRTGYRER